jgi:hypothetical protein
MKWGLLMLSVCLASCGRPNIDPEIKPYYDSFQNQYHKSPFHCGAEFGLPSGDRAAECSLLTGNITIRKKDWDALGFYGKETLVFHELGHCVLGLSHIMEDVDYSKGYLIHGSIMYPESFGDLPYYIELRSFYLDALAKDKVISGIVKIENK